MRIIHRLLLIAAIPLIVLTLTSANSIRTALVERKAANHVVAGVDAAVSATALVHRLQVERGASAGFIGSKGRNFGDELTRRRQDVDAALAVLRDAGLLEDPALGEATRHFNSLDAMRTRVDQLRVADSEAAEFYTSTIDALITFARSRIDRDASAELAGQA